MMHNGTDELEEFVCSSETALELKFVGSEEDFQNEELIFRPKYTHQVFGEKEKIFGYKNLKIKLYYTPDHLDTYLGIDYDARIDPIKHKGTKPDDIFKTLLKYIPEGFSINQDQFISKVIQPRPFTPFGELLHVHMSNEGKKYEVYKTDITAPGFREYHERLQTFVLWFIDAASFIDVDDEKWSFYLIYEKSVIDGDTHYMIVGYCTIYYYYAYPDKTKPRISQFLIFPPYQRRGLGTQLLQTIYNDILLDKGVLEVLVEDPSPELTALRDYVDCRNALQLPCFQSPLIHQSYSHEIEKECQEKLKINKHQCRRVYEILRLQVTDRSNSVQYYKFRVFVKNRLNGPYQKQQRDLDRLRRLGVMDHTELAVAAPLTSKEDRIRELQQIYEELESEYQNIIEKLATD